MVRDLARLTLAGFALALFVAGYTTFRIWQQGDQDERRQTQAIVVLGAAQYDGSPSPVLRARLDHAIELFRTGLAPAFVVTGGKLQNDRTTEAATARAYAIKAGVPAAAILVEDRGANTLESIESVAEILHARGLRTAVFVSDRAHMLRVLRMAIDQGIDAWGSPATTSPSDASTASQFEATLHELGGLAAYFVRGRSAAGTAEATLSREAGPTGGTPAIPAPARTLVPASP